MFIDAVYLTWARQIEMEKKEKPKSSGNMKNKFMVWIAESEALTMNCVLSSLAVEMRIYIPRDFSLVAPDDAFVEKASLWAARWAIHLRQGQCSTMNWQHTPMCAPLVSLKRTSRVITKRFVMARKHQSIYGSWSAERHLLLDHCKFSTVRNVFTCASAFSYSIYL